MCALPTLYNRGHISCLFLSQSLRAEGRSVGHSVQKTFPRSAWVGQELPFPVRRVPVHPQRAFALSSLPDRSTVLHSPQERKATEKLSQVNQNWILVGRPRTGFKGSIYKVHLNLKKGHSRGEKRLQGPVVNDHG